jgi:hypothetical protein
MATAHKPTYRSFKKARRYVHTLGIQTCAEWNQFCSGRLQKKKGALPPDIPKSPSSTYAKKGWVCWGDWFGNGKGPQPRTLANALKFEEARDFARSLKLSSSTQWRQYCEGKFPELKRRPKNLSAFPAQFYRRKGWVNWADWLGYTKRPSRVDFCDFEAARSFAQSLKLASAHEWFDYVRGRTTLSVPKPESVPKAPRTAYRNSGWTNWPDFLGAHLHRYRDFDSALKFAQSLNLAGKEEWFRVMSRDRLPKDIPRAPNNYYGKRGQWRGWRVWLKSVDYAPYEEARSFARNLKLKSKREWKLYCRGDLPASLQKPKNIPTNPERIYRERNEWKGWGDWLGANAKAGQRMSHFRKLLESSVLIRKS